MNGVPSPIACGVLFLFLASCAASSSSEEQAGTVTATVVVPDAPRSIGGATILDEIDVTTTAAAAPACSPVPDPWKPETGPVPDP